MRIPLRTLSLLLTLACFSGGAFAQTSDKGSVAYRWVDEHGVVHYGDSIPPKYSRDSRQILNSQGVEIGHVDAEKSQAQLAAEAKANERRVAQQQHDYFLLSTYTSVQDIESLRDERLSRRQHARARSACPWIRQRQ